MMSFPAQAENAGFAYSRTQISILRTHLKLDPSLLPWQQQQAVENNKLMLDVEVRDGRSLYQQEGWFNLTNYDENSGVLLMFGAPSQPPIVRSAQYAPVDILFLDKEGKITQIVPNIQLAELAQEIVPAEPISAFLFLKAGLCEKRVIVPGDSVEYGQFKKSPIILGDPAPKTQPVILQGEQPPKDLPKEGSAPKPSGKTDIKLLEKLYGEPEEPAH